MSLLLAIYFRRVRCGFVKYNSSFALTSESRIDMLHQDGNISASAIVLLGFSSFSLSRTMVFILVILITLLFKTMVS